MIVFANQDSMMMALQIVNHVIIHAKLVLDQLSISVPVAQPTQVTIDLRILISANVTTDTMTMIRR